MVHDGGASGRVWFWLTHHKAEDHGWSKRGLSGGGRSGGGARKTKKKQGLCRGSAVRVRAVWRIRSGEGGSRAFSWVFACFWDSSGCLFVDPRWFPKDMDRPKYRISIYLRSSCPNPCGCSRDLKDFKDFQNFKYFQYFQVFRDFQDFKNFND